MPVRWPRLEPRTLVAAILLGYAAYFVLAYQVERRTLLRFRLPSAYEVLTNTERVAHVRAEAQRLRALADIESWPPYAAWRHAVDALAIATALAAAIVGFVAAHRALKTIPGPRGKRRSALEPFFTAWCCAGFLAALVLGGLLAPQAIARKRYEKARTAFVAPVTPVP